MTELYQNHSVLWDMDGVLVDTGNFHFIAWKQTFDELGIPFELEDFRKTFGMNNAGILEWAFGRKPEPERISQISEKKESLFRKSIKGKAELLPGVPGWLRQFQAWGIKQAITSSAPPENIEVLVAELKIEDFFDAIVSGFDLPGKPNPDVFLKAANMLQVRPENCTVIEDAIAGVEGAKRARMKCIAVTTTNPANKLAKADYIFEHLEEMSKDDFSSLIG
ncbi:MAG: HAD family phosphatase [Anaerolineales bacterium]|nr:HAD family phosphatase [Anaerolineales bacterium]